jgi:hypothetical protein
LALQDRGSTDSSNEKIPVTHFNNAAERDIFEAIHLLKDDNLVWSSDMESIRGNLAFLMERIMQVEWHFVEPEIGDLALNLIRDRERQDNVGESNTTSEIDTMQSERSAGVTGQERQRHSCCCACRP